MTFRDRFILRLYYTFGDTLPVGRDVAGRLFALAMARGRFTPAQLNDLSLLLLLAILPNGSSWRSPIEQEVLRRDLHQQPWRVWQLLQTSVPPRLTEVLETARSQGPAVVLFRNLLAAILSGLDLAAIEINLSTFLGRLRLEDPNDRQPEARASLFWALRRHVTIPLGTVDFRCCLYLRVLNRVMQPGQPVPDTQPGTSPPWFSQLEQSERELLGRCLEYLSTARRNGPPSSAAEVEADLLLLYVQLYAQLTVEQIAGVLRYADANVTADQIALALERAWNAVL
jgi:hypothetical protein